MIPKTERDDARHPQEPPATSSSSARRDERYINDNLLIDMMLKEQTHIYVGGAGRCAGCGEGTALRMMCCRHRRQVRRPMGHHRRHRLQHGLHLDVSVQSVPRAVDQFAVRKRPGRRHGRAHRAGTRWAGQTSRSGASAATGRCSTSASSRCRACSPRGMNIKVFVLDTQVYSNTGGQASTSTYTGQNTKMSVHGKKYRRQAGTPQGDRPDRHDAPAHVRRADDLRPHQPLLQGGARRAGVRRPGRHQLLHDLPARARRRRQHGRRPGAAGRRHARVPAVDLRSRARATRSRSGCRCRATRR